MLLEFLLNPSLPSPLCYFTLSIQLCGSGCGFHMWQNPPLWPPVRSLPESCQGETWHIFLCPIPSTPCPGYTASLTPGLPNPYASAHPENAWRVVWNGQGVSLGDRQGLGHRSHPLLCPYPIQLLGTVAFSVGPRESHNWCHFLWVSWEDSEALLIAANIINEGKCLSAAVFNFWCASNLLTKVLKLRCQFPIPWNSNSVNMGIRICIWINPPELSFWTSYLLR